MLLLNHGANINVSGGTYFAQVAEAGEKELFSDLLTRNPDFEMLLYLLMDKLTDEEKLVEFLDLCLIAGGSEYAARNSAFLVSVMSRFPRSSALVKLLIRHGCPVGDLCNFTTEEQATPLVWALCQPQKKISDSVILELLSVGEDGKLSFLYPSSQF